MVRHGISFSNCAGYLSKSLIDEVFRDVFDYPEELVMANAQGNADGAVRISHADSRRDADIPVLIVALLVFRA